MPGPQFGAGGRVTVGGCTGAIGGRVACEPGAGGGAIGGTKLVGVLLAVVGAGAGSGVGSLVVTGAGSGVVTG